MVDALYKEGLVYADEKQNAVFIRRSIGLQNDVWKRGNNRHGDGSKRGQVERDNVEKTFSPSPPHPSPRQPSPVNSQTTEITGATLGGTAGEDNSFKGLAKGTKRSEGWFYFQQGGQSSDPINRAVLVESPIDAMSFAVLGVDHVFVADREEKCLYAGYVGWLHSPALRQLLADIKQQSFG